MEQRQTGYMRKMLMTALLLACAWARAAAPVALKPAPETGNYRMQSYASGGQPLWAWCDALTRVLTLVQYGVPAVAGAKASDVTSSELREWPKTAAGLGKMQVSNVQIGPPDPGAGQIYQSLKVTSGPRKGQSGFLHTSNVENVQDPAYRMTKTGEFKLGNSVYTCRYVPQAAFMGVTTKRTVIIWDTGDVVTYATRNFDGSAGVYVTEGRKRSTVEGGMGYEFKTADGFSYSVMIDEYRPASGAKLTVYKAKNLKMSETFVAYSVSFPKASK